MDAKKPQAHFPEEGPRVVDERMTSGDGVDVTLIQWMLSLTPTERLQVLQQSVQPLARLCNESSFA